MFTTCLLVVEVMLVAMAAIAVVFHSFFLTEALAIDEMVHHFQHTASLARNHVYTGLLLLFSAAAVEALRRVMECADRTDHLARVRDDDTGYEVLAPETPSAAAGASSIPQNRTSAPLAEDVCTSPVPVIAAISDHQDGDALHVIARPSDATEERQALYYWLGSIAFIALAIVLMWLFFLVGIFVSYGFLNWEHGTIEQLKRTWNNVYTKSDVICPFMETYRCSGGLALCEYPNVILPDVRPDSDSSTGCPVCDFTDRREPLVVQGTCIDLIDRRTSSDGLLYLQLCWGAVLLLLIVLVWLIVRLVRSCVSARVQPTLSTVPAM